MDGNGTRMAFDFVNRCLCCERHQKDKPVSLYTGWVDIETDTTGKIKDTNCQCTCREVARQLAREDSSVFEIYFNLETTVLFVRLPGEDVPTDKGLKLLATATWDTNTVRIDPQYWNHIADQFGDNGENFETTWMYKEIYDKLTS